MISSCNRLSVRESLPEGQQTLELTLLSHEHFHYPELVSASNIAIYGGLTALATLSRKDLKEQVLHSANFKLFLELEPIMRETILGKTLIQQLWPQN